MKKRSAESWLIHTQNRRKGHAQVHAGTGSLAFPKTYIFPVHFKTMQKEAENFC